MEKDIKHIWVAHEERSDTKAKAFVVSMIIILGIAAFLVCIYSVIPALLA